MKIRHAESHAEFPNLSEERQREGKDARRAAEIRATKCFFENIRGSIFKFYK